jgi:hypothetical protein
MQTVKGNAGRDEMTEIMGDEISRIISEQRNLEQRYAQLVSLRSSLTGISNKDNFLKVKEEIKQVAQALRENTRHLCRVLKDNPNLQGNLMKIQKDRQELAAMLDELTKDLYGLNYHSFGYNIAEEMQKQDLLTRKRQQEKETTQNAKQLQEDYKKELQEYQKESKEAQDEIQKLRDELAEAKTYQAFRLKYEEKEARAREACESRQHQHDLYEKEEEVKALVKKKEVEEMVHNRLEKFMERKFDQFNKELEEWKYKHEQDARDLNERIVQMTEKKDKAKTKLEALNEEVEGEKQRQLEREREEREREDKLRQEREDNERKTEACRLIAREYLKYKELAGKKKKPRKKKGKKGK